MTYRLPLAERIRHAANKRWRYRTDPEYRLACINRARVQHGRPTLTELPESALSAMDCPHRPRGGFKGPFRRDERGRFA